MEALLGDATQTDVQDVTTERLSAYETPKINLPPAKLVDLSGRPAKGDNEPGPQQLPEEGDNICPP